MFPGLKRKSKEQLSCRLYQNSQRRWTPRAQGRDGSSADVELNSP
jgi:hypothetical protein